MDKLTMSATSQRPSDGSIGGGRAALSFLVVTIVVSFGVMPTDSNSHQAEALFAASATSTPLENIFPDASDSTFAKADRLVELLGGGLGVLPIAPFTENSHELSIISDELNTSKPFEGVVPPFQCYHYWGAGADGTKVGALYGLNSRLVEIKARQDVRAELAPRLVNGTWGFFEVWVTPSIGSWRAYSPSVDEFLAVARAVAHSLGIPDGYVFESRVVSDSSTDAEGNIQFTTTEVRLWSKVGDRIIAGTNALNLVFTNLNLTSIDLYPFYQADEVLSLVDESEAASAALDFLEMEVERAEFV